MTDNHAKKSGDYNRSAADRNELDLESYLDMIQYACADNLRGIKCSVKADPLHAVSVFHICEAYELEVRQAFL